jgi:hypothetical protein
MLFSRKFTKSMSEAWDCINIFYNIQDELDTLFPANSGIFPLGFCTRIQVLMRLKEVQISCI